MNGKTTLEYAVNHSISIYGDACDAALMMCWHYKIILIELTRWDHGRVRCAPGTQLTKKNRRMHARIHTAEQANEFDLVDYPRQSALDEGIFNAHNKKKSLSL